MPNPQNLKPAGGRTTPEERSALCRKAALAGAEKRRKRQSLKAILDVLLTMPSELREGMDRQMSMCIAQIEEAEKGNKQSADWVRDTVGEKPKDKAEVSGPSGGPLLTKEDIRITLVRPDAHD